MESILIKLEAGKPLYVQIYEYFRKEIERGRLVQGERLPSIRGLATTLNVSKITVEKAYGQLQSEGYIDNADRARYRVAAVERPAGRCAPAPQAPPALPVPQAPPVRYDFASGEMDAQGFSFPLWKRYLGKALADPQRLMRYGATQGEEELRREIARYLHQSRGVAASPAQIVVGPGVQSLLGTLCSLLQDDAGRIAFEDPGFRNGRRVFADHGYDIVSIGMQADGMDIQALSESGVRLVYASPSHQFPSGFIMPIGKRNRLLAWADAVDGLIIEDDYDSEFRYYGRPIPALKGLDRSDRVVYLGSFSKIIPPSIRIAYMLLPPRLLERFRQKSALYNQSASTTEQLALAAFLQEGQLEKQIRRLRKLYQEKRAVFLEALQTAFSGNATVHDGGSGLFTLLDLRTPLSPQQVKARARDAGCRVALVQEYALHREPVQRETCRLLLYFSSIPKEEIPAAVSLLRQAWSV